MVVLLLVELMLTAKSIHDCCGLKWSLVSYAVVCGSVWCSQSSEIFVGGFEVTGEFSGDFVVIRDFSGGQSYFQWRHAKQWFLFDVLHLPAKLQHSLEEESLCLVTGVRLFLSRIGIFQSKNQSKTIKYGPIQTNPVLKYKAQTPLLWFQGQSDLDP